ncbi:MAG: hypothetical protein M3177_00365, partial [Pseudomonadota bacterium]|nr:hypothetical protein [Pseudomonadota bacterium]
MRLVLHFGAHKTATTYIQSTLAASQSSLSDYGVGYVPLDEMRERVTPLAGPRRLNAGGTLRKLIDEHGDRGRLILSDENMSGLCSNAVKAGTFYAEIDKRAERLVAAAQGHEVEI